MVTTFFFFGSHPTLSYAELKSVCHTLLSDAQYTLYNHKTYATLETAQSIDANAFMGRIGGTIKIAEAITATVNTIDDWLVAHLPTDGKNVFGVSLYSDQSPKERMSAVRHIGMSLKRSLQASERSVRFVQSQDPTLSAVIVTKEHLIAKGCDLCIVRDGKQTLFARTVAVQPFEEFSHRDYGRPGRDSKSGMLPPKLARMMVNLSGATQHSVLLDPFCGSGTVLQEALLMGIERVYGSDVSGKAVDDTMRNLEWMKLRAQDVVEQPAETLRQNLALRSAAPFDAIIFEGFLGKPKPYERDIPEIKRELTQLYTKVFLELAASLAHDGTIVAALPFWLLPEFDERLPVENILKRAELTLTQKPLYYFRPNARVGREIIVAKKINA
ncbi:MAG: RsmD family RNA methyltransferase [Candidatus Kerfeldbacteria bacterium]|nr:RsmD family RNA methyltransferase [Candidatus Kerfeldbacteria bacterium]